MSEQSLSMSKVKAWGVHGFTALGVILALLAALAVLEGNPQACLLWLGLALLVDGLDGSLARRYHVQSVLPDFDGSILDLVIDYLTYVFIPAIFVYRFIPLPEYSLLPAVGLILLSSLFCFCNRNMKSQDNYFVGFPAAWNLVVVYLFLLDFAPWLSLASIVLLAGLTLTRMKFLHPFRVRQFMPLNIAVTLVWMGACAWLILLHPRHPGWLLAIWLLATSYFVGICLWRTAREWLRADA